MKQTACLFLLYLTGCAMMERIVDAPTIIMTPPKVEAAEAAPPPPPEEEAAYAVWWETPGLTWGRYEPANGTYLGAALADGESGMRAFARKAGRKHALYAADMAADAPYPETWMLECIAAQGTPLVLLRQGETGFSTENIAAAAAWLGAYNIPLLVAYEPYADAQWEAAEYKHRFRYVRAVFMEYAPKAAFVWLADGADSGAFYPGDDAADWVGLRALAAWDGYDAAVETIDAFYFTYQRRKPVLLVTGVSHFTEDGYTYHVPEAEETLAALYARVSRAYPRLKALVYADYTLAGETYAVTLDGHMSAAYAAAVTDKRFLGALADENITQPGWLSAEHAGRYTDGKTYIHALPPGEDGGKYIDAGTLTGRFAITDHPRRVIFVYGMTKP